jgi:hypothetical protein
MHLTFQEVHESLLDSLREEFANLLAFHGDPQDKTLDHNNPVRQAIHKRIARIEDDIFTLKRTWKIVERTRV